MIFRSPEQMLEFRSHNELLGKERSIIEEEVRKFQQEGPDLETFKEIYPPEVLQADQQRVDKLKGEFSHEPTESREQKFYATALELLVNEFGNAWIPGYLSKASEFDDFVNHMDLFLELQSETGEPFRLAIDVTSSEQNAEKKINDIISNLQQGKFAHAKYFESQLDDEHGYQEMPRIVLGADRAEIIELAKLYLNHKQAEKPEVRARFLAQIQEHRFRREIMSELRSQVSKWISILKDAPSPEVAVKIAYLENVQHLLGEFAKNEKASVPDATGSFNKVGQMIEEALART